MSITEFQYSDYSVTQNHISDLGVGASPSREIFTVALLVFGLLITAVSRLFEVEGSHLWQSLTISGISAVGVALSNVAMDLPLVLFSLMAFLFANPAALLCLDPNQASLLLHIARTWIDGIQRLCRMGP